MSRSWITLIGDFEYSDADRLAFTPKTQPIDPQSGQTLVPYGACKSNERFSQGRITFRVCFHEAGTSPLCHVTFNHDLINNSFMSAGLGGFGTLASVISVKEQQELLASFGEERHIESGREYQVALDISGSRVVLRVDDIELINVVIPSGIAKRQIGFWCRSEQKVSVSGIQVTGQQEEKAFVVMQFGSPFDQLYQEVILDVCKEFELLPIRADELVGPGLIIEDVTNGLIESKVVLAEITPANPNVYYELGYAHAIRKPVILMVDKDELARNSSKLPFDIAGYRAIFYENTIAGKSRIVEDLRKHLSLILGRDPKKPS